MQNEFDTKLAAAGEIFEKLAHERGLTINDFSDDEAADIISTIIEGDSAPDAKVATETPVTEPVPAPVVAPTTEPTPAPEAKVASELLYAQAYQEVTKMAAQQGIDVTAADPKELHEAVLKQAAFMSDPVQQAKVAAMQEKVAEADMLGRVMAHSYVDELAKIAAAKQAGEPPPFVSKDKDEEKEKNEKKASLVAALRAKQAGEMPPQFAAHAKGKGGEGEDKDEKKEKEEAEKKASFVAARVQAHLLSQGIDPLTGQKLASVEEIDAEALKILKEKGWIA